jgi:hypothetical protein
MKPDDWDKAVAYWCAALCCAYVGFEIGWAERPPPRLTCRIPDGATLTSSTEYRDGRLSCRYADTLHLSPRELREMAAVRERMERVKRKEAPQ